MASRLFSRAGLRRARSRVALGVCFAGSVSAQSTSRRIFGKAEPPGQTITIVSVTPAPTRTVTTDAHGPLTRHRYPPGTARSLGYRRAT